EYQKAWRTQWPQREGFKGDFGDKTKGSFGADHEPLKDRSGSGVVEECVQAVAVCIFDGELLLDPSREGLIAQNFVTNLQESVVQLPLGVEQFRIDLAVGGIDNAT